MEALDSGSDVAGDVDHPPLPAGVQHRRAGRGVGGIPVSDGVAATQREALIQIDHLRVHAGSMHVGIDPLGDAHLVSCQRTIHGILHRGTGIILQVRAVVVFVRPVRRDVARTADGIDRGGIHSHFLLTGERGDDLRLFRLPGRRMSRYPHHNLHAGIGRARPQPRHCSRRDLSVAELAMGSQVERLRVVARVGQDVGIGNRPARVGLATAIGGRDHCSRHIRRRRLVGSGVKDGAGELRGSGDDEHIYRAAENPRRHTERRRDRHLAARRQGVNHGRGNRCSPPQAASISDSVGIGYSAAVT